MISSLEFKNIRYQSDVYDTTDCFDCVVIPYAMTNMRGAEVVMNFLTSQSSQSRALLVKNLWNRLSVGGYMVSRDVYPLGDYMS